MSFLPYRPAEPTAPRALRKAFSGQGLITYKPDSKRRSYTNLAVAASLSKNGDASENPERAVSVKPEPQDLPLIWISADMTHTGGTVAGVQGSNWRGRKRRPSPEAPGVQIQWRLKSEENPRRLSISPQHNLKAVSIPRRARGLSQQMDTDIRVPKVEEDEEEMGLSPWDLTSGPVPEARCELRRPSDRVTAAAKRRRAVRKLMQSAHNRNRSEADNVQLARAEALQNIEMLCPRTDLIDTANQCQVEDLQYPHAKVTAANGFIVKAEPVECEVPPRRSFFDVVLNTSPN
ncbi:hypothetical protein D9619_013089 [Psilocybe cf. subviscida]|uniref:Uncharacterized protein n=1 Tax=Psilocybe cf. subviscida TaxID=2480587 RepID=A0A8H5EVL1_9AGAR|nr:hypothetical protein D9619_013089 [Psilocybe cf. subviscida]